VGEPGRRRRRTTTERLLTSASDAFYADGITATGVDALVERSGVSKPTLYAHFGSKRELLAAALRWRHEERRARLERFLTARGGDPRDRLLAVFDWVGEAHREESWRGCPFLNAAAELPAPNEPARAVITDHKRWLWQVLRDLAAGAGEPAPDELAHQLQLLLEGAHARVLVDGDLDAAPRARRVAERLLDGWDDARR
jgi:AcrR family transcriptional regulator